MKSPNNFDEIPIFVDTNLGTHLAVTVSPDINVADLKRKLGEEHLSCFASHGEIMVHELMVKRRSHLYRLPDALPIKIAFFGYQGTWFLHMHASVMVQDVTVPETSPCQGKPLNADAPQKLSLKHAHYSHSQTTQSRENRPSISTVGKIFESSIGTEERLLKRDPLESKVAGSMNLSKEISVTAIISTYFSDLEEVTSCKKQRSHIFEETHCNEIVGSTTRSSGYSAHQAKPKKMVESDTDTVCSINNVVSRARRAPKRGCTKAKEVSRPRKMASAKVQIGKKIVQAANNISVSISGRKLLKSPVISRCGNLFAPESRVLVRNLAFEIGGFDD